MINMQNRLKELRNKKHLTLKELGEQVGMPNNTLSQYETGKREPKLETWQKLADFFDVPILYLQGFGLSNEEAINICWEWIQGGRGNELHQIPELLENYLKKHFNQKDIKRIFENKQTFSNFMNNWFKGLFSYYSLSNMKDADDLERKLTIAVSGVSTNVYDGVLAQIENIDFKKESNEVIHEKLRDIFTDIFMYIDSDDNNKN